ncbi:hypothetical protein MUK42_08950 [Musa troglodytarum]|uniref:BHLH domain-containing protein n=1 Tax=Musa troglodytarum TaxID=320322 RepID=A0A9E7EAU7_9LILI|nr:hypothetical protein MUK42_08950 [Musa troglodytarum]URD73794.1 hypothetical protein MUK42_08950 [Musa troglodytarum]URD73795.1 hypothetical protein MUK42_08950 [Musa troglodytarum]
MEMNEDRKFGLEKSHGDHLSNHSSGVSADWQFNTPAMSAAPPHPCTAASLVPPLTSSPFLSAPMAEAFVPGLWNHHATSVGGSNIQNTTSAINSIPIGRPVAMSSKGMLLSTPPLIFPPSLPHFPADSGFIERAARFSCLSGGGFMDVNLLRPSQSVAPARKASKVVMETQVQNSELSMTADKVVSLPAAYGSIDQSRMDTRRDRRSPHISNSESQETNFCEGGQDGNVDSSGNSSPSDLGANKRKRTIQDMEKDQVQRGPQSSSEATETKHKVEQNSSKHGGNNGKDNSEAAEEGYVHVRARRGQATNSHSLAERVRREKISERMKYLQELVPGCSKVTGKAVMLDEIINYVQSLQRQVEFLSMKLAAVNPQLDFSVERLLAKNLREFHGSPLSIAGFSQEMSYPRVYPSQQGLGHAGSSTMVNPSDAYRRTMNTQLPTTSGYKELSMQMHNPWNEEIVMQMDYDANHPPNAQEMNRKPDGFAI